MDQFINSTPPAPRITDGIAATMKSLVIEPEYNRAQWFVLMDELTHKHCFPLLRDVFPGGCHQIIIGSGERHKNLHTCEFVWKHLLDSDADRNAVLINLGGGVITDIGGFAASAYKRGIRFINIPTTLLGMVDAALGGKTGVDFNSFKNIIGVFAYPQAVIIDPVFLKTLPEKEIRNGMIEICKHALIADADDWHQLRDLILSVEKDAVHTLVQSDIIKVINRAVEIKSSFVNRDPQEKNVRKFLNFGHTVGHALETYSLKHDDHPLSHGQAVAAGLVCETFLSMKVCGLPLEVAHDVKMVMKRLFPSLTIHMESYSEVLHFMQADKKSEEGKVQVALLEQLGKPVMKSGIESGLFLESFQYLNK